MAVGCGDFNGEVNIGANIRRSNGVAGEHMTTYRWNTSAAAETFDAGAPAIHPFYVEIQDEILSLLAADQREPECVSSGSGG